MTERDADHLSIGEVLAELSDEFPDVTISKIRFLESQGLVDPERTPSGYRKFYAADLARLRWILYQQKEHFLPLKVIKERLDEVPPGGEATLFTSIDAPAGADAPDADEPAGPDAPAAVAPETTSAPTTSAPTTSAPTTSAPTTSATTRAPAGRTSSARGTGRRAPTFSPTLPADDAEDAPIGSTGGDDRHTRAELAAGAGVPEAQVVQLESYGLLAPIREVDGTPEYDDEALEVVRIAAGFFDRGVEARHLRMYRTFADREAMLFGQVLMPYVRQRNPEARARLQEELGELATLGRRLRAALLRDAVRDSLAE